MLLSFFLLEVKGKGRWPLPIFFGGQLTLFLLSFKQSISTIPISIDEMVFYLIFYPYFNLLFPRRHE